MEEEIFDKFISDKITSHDLNFERLDDKEKIWKTISKKRRKGTCYKLTAALVICAFSYGLLLYRGNQPDVSKTKKPDTGKPGFSAEEKAVQELQLSSVFRPMKSAPGVLNKIAIKKIEEVRLLEDRESDKIVTEFTPVKPVLEAAAVEASDTVQEKEAFKVTFKRGAQAEDTEIKVSLARGKKIKFDIFKKQTYDSTTYVSNENRPFKQPIRLNF